MAPVATGSPAWSAVVGGCFLEPGTRQTYPEGAGEAPNIDAVQRQHSTCSCPSKPVDSRPKTRINQHFYLPGQRMNSSLDLRSTQSLHDILMCRTASMIRINSAPCLACRLDQLPVRIQYWDKGSKELRFPSDETAAVSYLFCVGDNEKQVSESDPVT